MCRRMVKKVLDIQELIELALGVQGDHIGKAADEFFADKNLWDGSHAGAGAKFIEFLVAAVEIDFFKVHAFAL
jgi:hypothetical protein